MSADDTRSLSGVTYISRQQSQEPHKKQSGLKTMLSMKPRSLLSVWGFVQWN